MIINTDKFKKTIFFFIASAILYFGNLITVNAYDLNIKIENKWVVAFIFSIVLICFMIITKYNAISEPVIRNRKFRVMLLWEIFIVFIFLSKFLYGEFNLLEYLLYSILIPISFFNKKIQEYKNIILIASVFSIIPLIYILGPMNSLGIIMCIAGINLLNTLRIYNSKTIPIYIVIVIFNIIIFITKSRTALIAFLFVSAIVIFITLKKEKISFRELIKIILKISVFVVLIYFSYDYISNLIFGKYTISGSDILSGRRRMWVGTFQIGVKLFGNGENYFMYYYNIGDAHNTFIQILGAYGLLSFILFILICIYIIFKSIKCFKKPEYICFFSAFLLLSLTENLFFINSRMIYANILFLTYLGCLINEKKQQ
jgi:hypothetical protein